MNTTTHKPQSGFTLVELLVVISIIGILVSMMMPAINSAREAANRAQCSNNIKQMALACISYDQAHQAFPCACTQTGQWAEYYNGNGVQPQPGNQRENWVIMVLPFIDQTALYNEFKERFANTDKKNSVAINNQTFQYQREKELATMKCPSDTNNRFPYNDGTYKWGRGNYGANMGLTLADYLGHDLWWGNTGARGVMGPRHALSQGEITDGASNTILLAELRSGLTTTDSRGTWALGGAGSSATCRNGYICGDDNGPNILFYGSDDIYGCPTSLPDADRVRLKMPCISSSNRQATCRSMHMAGVNTAFADGSVHFISDSVQTRSSFTEDFNSVKANKEFAIWDCLNLSADGRSLSNDEF